MKQIKEPSNVSEFEVHAYVYTELRRIGINARGEVKVPFFYSANRRAACRFDIAIFSDGFLSGIIEIKSAVRRHKSEDGWLGTRQGSRYSSFGVPVKIVYGMDQAQSFISESEKQNSIAWG